MDAETKLYVGRPVSTAAAAASALQAVIRASLEPVYFVEPVKNVCEYGPNGLTRSVHGGVPRSAWGLKTIPKRNGTANTAFQGRSAANSAAPSPTSSCRDGKWGRGTSGTGAWNAGISSCHSRLLRGTCSHGDW